MRALCLFGGLKSSPSTCGSDLGRALLPLGNNDNFKKQLIWPSKAKLFAHPDLAGVENLNRSPSSLQRNGLSLQIRSAIGDSKTTHFDRVTRSRVRLSFGQTDTLRPPD